MAENIVFFCGHNDDQIIGGGGTIAKYSKEGKHIFTIIFSYGESSHPHFKREVAVKMRVRESSKARDILGREKQIYLGLKEGSFPEEIRKQGIRDRLKKFISETNPTKIFTHSIDDPHPDHRAVYKFITSLLKEIKYKGDLYSFDIWNPIRIRRRNLPRLIVDVSDTFPAKIAAMDAHKSQKMTKIILWWNIYLKAMFLGFLNGVKYAEVFYKIN